VTSVLITGAGGFLGQRLTESLSAAGHQVRGLVRTPVTWTCAVEEVVGDLASDPALAGRVAQGIEVVIHLAGANEIATARDPRGAVADTIAAAQRIAHSGVARAIYFSTVHVYGSALAPGNVVSEDTPAVPNSPYAEARLACEEEFVRSGLPTAVLRLSNAVGAPRQALSDRWTLVTNELCREGATTGRLTLRTDGSQWRDFIALRDIESAVGALVGTAPPEGTYNLASGVPVSIRQLATLIGDMFEALGERRPELNGPPPSPHVPEAWRLDTTAIGQIGIRPTTPLSDAVTELIQFCLEHRRALA
jgi:UDP-glucose 4-epimerase